MLAKHSIFTKMNELGAAKVPFFFMIDFLKENGEVIPLNELPDEIKFEIDSPKKESFQKDFKFNKFPISFDEYLPKFNYVHENLLFGNSYLTNLTLPTKIETDLSLNEIFQSSEAKYKLKYKDEFVCFSPERFVKIEDQKIQINKF